MTSRAANDRACNHAQHRRIQSESDLFASSRSSEPRFAVEPSPITDRLVHVVRRAGASERAEAWARRPLPPADRARGVAAHRGVRTDERLERANHTVSTEELLIMVYIPDWETFYSESEKLYLEHPAHTRFVVKYRHKDGKVVLKVTNDRVCLKYETDQAQDIKRIDKLNNLFVTYMCGRDPHETDETEDGASAQRSDRPNSSEDAAGKRRRGKR